MKRGTIRLIQNKGSWELKEAAGGEGTALRYRILTDPGAALPGWLIDIANQSSVPDVLRAFHKRWANRGTGEAGGKRGRERGRPGSLTISHRACHIRTVPSQFIFRKGCIVKRMMKEHKRRRVVDMKLIFYGPCFAFAFLCEN